MAPAYLLCRPSADWDKTYSCMRGLPGRPHWKLSACRACTSSCRSCRQPARAARLLVVARLPASLSSWTVPGELCLPVGCFQSQTLIFANTQQAALTCPAACHSRRSAVCAGFKRYLHLCTYC